MLLIAPTSLRLYAIAQALTIVAATATSPDGARAQASMPCDKVEAPLHIEAIAEVRRHVAATWLEIGHNFYSGYRMKSPPANPFDLARPKESGGKQVEEGYIWVAGLSCELTATSDSAIVVTLRAGAMSFAEKGARWTQPLYDRQLTQFMLTRPDTQWIVRENRGEESVLTAEDELRHPTSEEIPSRNKKLGLPCTSDQVWERKRCVARTKAKASVSF